MGVPCITLKGKCHAQNVGASILSAVGLQDWIANNEDEYIDIAKVASSDLAKLAKLRNELRETLLNSALCNGKEFVENLEDAYKKLWKRRVDQNTNGASEIVKERS